MSSVHCKLCDHKIAETDKLSFYKQSTNSYHLTVKIEKRNVVSKNLQILKQPNPKKAEFMPFVFQCANIDCSKKLGGDLCIGPKAENVLCFDKEAIYFLESSKE